MSDIVNSHAAAGPRLGCVARRSDMPISSLLAPCQPGAPPRLATSPCRALTMAFRARPVRVHRRLLARGACRSAHRVAGTTATNEQGQVVGAGDAYAQTKYILEKIGRALSEAGASFGDVVRTRTFVTDISRWEEIGRAHGEVFRDVRPAATMVEVTALITPELMVEIEVDAFVARRPPL